jgi:uncharacterized protein (DUF2062 family)
MQTAGMPKHLLHRFMPDAERIARYPGLRLIGNRLADPSLWQLNRRSAAGAVFWGLWCAMLPIPMQMALAAMLSLCFRVNLPLSLVMVWVNNPFTLIPIIWLAYFTGSLLLGMPMLDTVELQRLFADLLTVLGHLFSDGHHSASANLLHHLKPIALGGVVMGFVFGCVGYVAMRVFWRWHVVSAWKKRKAKRMAAKGV